MRSSSGILSVFILSCFGVCTDSTRAFAEVIPQEPYSILDYDARKGGAHSLSLIGSEISLFSNDFYSNPSGSPRTAPRGFVTTDLRLSRVPDLTKGQTGISNFDIAGGYGLTPASGWFGYYRQAYVGVVDTKDRAGVFAGAKYEDWSVIDRDWNTGIFEPRFRWDYLHPERVGLFGFFFHFTEPTWKLVAFATPITIPERGADFSSDSGGILSDNPYFISPGSQLVVLQHMTPVSYNLTMPPLAKLLVQPGGGAIFRYGGNQGYWGSFSYAYKPINQPMVNFNGYLILKTQTGEVDIYPRIMYHQVAEVDQGWNNHDTHTWIAFMSEMPVHQTPEQNLTYQEVYRSFVVSPGILTPIKGHGQDAIMGGLSYMRVDGGSVGAEGPLTTSGNLFEQRFPHDNAFAAKVNWPLMRSLAWNSRVVYDTTVEGLWISTDFKYQNDTHLAAMIGADVLGSGMAADTATLIGRYRGNDQLRGEVSYVF